MATTSLRRHNGATASTTTQELLMRARTAVGTRGMDALPSSHSASVLTVSKATIKSVCDVHFHFCFGFLSQMHAGSSIE